MDNTEDCLVKVFETVFPDLPADKIRAASQSNVSTWDSVAAITLMNVMEEEFAIEIDFDRAAELSSFPEILAYVKETVAASAGPM
jgi:acyl carrier protein